MTDVDDNFLELQVVYEDLPDLIELGIRVRSGNWSAFSKAYTSPSDFAARSRALLLWVTSPEGRVQLDAGADTGIGWMVLDFYTIDRAGHARCAIRLATGENAWDARPEETWRFMIELITEIGLIERFARECIAISSDFSGKARLIGLRQ